MRLELHISNCYPLCVDAAEARSCLNGAKCAKERGQKEKKTNPPAVFSSRKLFRKQGFNEEVENTNCRISVVKVTRGSCTGRGYYRT